MIENGVKRKIDETDENSLNWVETKNGEAASIPFCRIFQDKSIGDKLRSQNLLKKIILKGSAAGQQKKIKKNRGSDTK